MRTRNILPAVVLITIAAVGILAATQGRSEEAKGGGPTVDGVMRLDLGELDQHGRDDPLGGDAGGVGDYEDVDSSFFIVHDHLFMIITSAGRDRPGSSGKNAPVHGYGIETFRKRLQINEVDGRFAERNPLGEGIVWPC